MTIQDQPEQCPLVVDLDGTLIATDMLWESLLLLVKNQPMDLLRLPVWLWRGKVAVKTELASRCMPAVEILPYREDVLAYVRQQKAQGRRIILATASHENMARQVSSHLGLFNFVLATGGGTNLRSEAKLAQIRAAVGDQPFDYIGDSQADLPVWAAADRAMLVCPGRRLLADARAVCSPHRLFGERSPLVGPLLRALRPFQWVKNLLLFVPLLLAHQAMDLRRLGYTCPAFICFCAAASGVYVLNDLFDLETDRRHPRKKARPFASGALPVSVGVAAVPLLFAGAVALAALTLPVRFMLLLLLYLLMSSAYTLHFKRRLLLDVVVLAGLYTLRVLAGGAGSSVPVSPWMLAFSMFFFTSLAFAKRYAELTVNADAGSETVAGRGYLVEDREIIQSVGPASGYLSILIFCLYISGSTTGEKLYPNSKFLWLINPILMYWTTRIWFFARRRRLVDDPVLFALRDRVSWICGLCILILAALASTKTVLF